MITRKNVLGIAVSAALFAFAAPISANDLDDLDLVDDVLELVEDVLDLDGLDLGGLDLDGLDLGDLDLGSSCGTCCDTCGSGDGGGVVGDDNASDTDANDNLSDTDSNILKDILSGSDSDGIDIDDSLDGSQHIVKENEILNGSDSDVVDADGDNKVGSDNDIDLGDVL